MKLSRRIGLITIGKVATHKQQPLSRKISWFNEKILKHQDDTSIKQFKFSKYTISYKRPYELLHTYNEVFVREIYKFKPRSSKPLIIDCGSNIGLSVLYFKIKYPECKVLSFEPDEQNFELLNRNVESNNLHNVVINNKAVWVTDGTISFNSSGSEASRISTESDSSKNVETIRLKNLLDSIEEIDFLKIDIEGAEYEVLNDCAENLHKIHNMFLEYHGNVQETYKIERLLSHLNEFGFNSYIENAATSLKSPFYDQRSNMSFDVQLNIYCYK